MINTQSAWHQAQGTEQHREGGKLCSVRAARNWYGERLHHISFLNETQAISEKRRKIRLGFLSSLWGATQHFGVYSFRRSERSKIFRKLSTPLPEMGNSLSNTMIQKSPVRNFSQAADLGRSAIIWLRRRWSREGFWRSFFWPSLKPWCVRQSETLVWCQYDARVDQFTNELGNFT